MTIAPTTAILKRRLDRYLWWDENLANKRLRAVLEYHFSQFDEFAIVGGMVRDFARVGKTGFVSDVDLVVNAPDAKVADMAKAVGARVNAFGGYSISSQGWNVDFWALGNTWAVREGLVEAKTLGDFTRSTFFNYDAVVYDVRRRRVLCDESYLDRLHGKEMEVNLLPNPTIVGNLFRAIRRVLLWDLSAGPRLKAFIDQYLDNEAFREIVRMDQRKSASPFLHKYKSVSELKEATISKEYRRAMATYYGKQLDLPGISTEKERAVVGPQVGENEIGRGSAPGIRRVTHASLIKKCRNSPDYARKGDLLL